MVLWRGVVNERVKSAIDVETEDDVVVVVVAHDRWAGQVPICIVLYVCVCEPLISFDCAERGQRRIRERDAY